jgi:endonuclease/exonuclease/phosphatase family metal-dependent hydrolase
MPTLWQEQESIDRGEAHDADLSSILAARLRQAARVHQIMSGDEHAPSSSPQILLGDMNSHPHALVAERSRGDLVDAFAAGGRGFGYTLGPRWPRARYDRVLVQGLTVHRVDVDGSEASDHFALVADLTVAR